MRAVFPEGLKKVRLAVIAESFLTAYALTAVFHPPLVPASYETVIDYGIASIYELLGEYHFSFLLLWILGVFFYAFFEDRRKKSGGFGRRSSVLLASFFSLCLLLGQSYYETGTWEYCFGSIVNFLKSLLAFTGYGLFFYHLIGAVSIFLDSRGFVGEKGHFFSRHAFGKAFLILLCAYLPFIVLSFPGNLCWDAIGQIEQVIGNAGYSTHHPLFHTLLMGGMVKLGGALFGSYEIGLFCYILLQAVLLAAALAGTIAVLARRGAKFSLLLVLMLLYCVTPVYSNAVSTALKDVPFSAFVIGYVICFSLLAEDPRRLGKARFVCVFVLLQIGVILMRNNGLFVVLLSGAGGFLLLFRRLDGKGRIRLFFSGFACSVVIAQLFLALLAQVCHAEPGSRGEMLSVPFQQTARYLQIYGNEIGQDEREAIEAVLGDVETVAAVYDPKSADPVKALFQKDSSAGELVSYFGAWFRGLCRHPAVYAQAFLVHIYGWFAPCVPNSIRYEAEYDAIRQGGLFPNADKLMIFYYRFLEKISPVSVLENTGVSVWALFYLTFYQRRKKKGTSRVSTLPLWVSLLVCMAAPCFVGHPRYAFPILFTIPFLYGFEMTGKREVSES